MHHINQSRFYILASCAIGVALVGGAIHLSATEVETVSLADSVRPALVANPSVELALERLEGKAGGAVRVHLDDVTGQARFVGFGVEGYAFDAPDHEFADRATRAWAFLQAHGGAFGIRDPDSELRLSGERENANGAQVEFRQVHRDVSVRDGQLRVYFDHDSNLIAVDAHILSGLTVDTTAGIDDRAASALAVEALSRELSLRSDFTTSNLQASSDTLVLHRTEAGDDHLAYEIEVGAGDEAGLVLVDGHTGQVLDVLGVEKTVSEPLESKTVLAVDGTFTTVTLSNTYVDPVVVCTAEYQNNSVPIVTRVKDVGATSFKVRLQNPGDQFLPAAEAVHCLIVESGTHTYDGHVIQAEYYTSTVTDRKGSWAGELQTYGHAFTQPVVIGQVMTENDPSWSVFWDKGAAYRVTPPTATTLYTGKHVGEDPDTTRLDEEIGFIVFDTAHGMIGGVEFEAARGPKTIAGAVNSPPYLYTYDTAFPAAPDVAISSMAALTGNDGAWMQLHGSPSATATTLQLSVDEDQAGDPDRSHTLEQAAYVVFAQEVVFPVVAPADCPGGLDSECDDGLFCNGDELCSGVTCQPSTGDPCAAIGQLCNEDIDACVTGPALRMETFALNGIDGNFQTVPTFHTYVSPVVVCDVEYETNTTPIVVRLDNVFPTSFDIKLQNPSGGPVSAEDAWCIVMEEGPWQQDGVKFEAQKYVSTVTDSKTGWFGTVQAYNQPYATPTVIGQVMSFNDPAFSVYWQQGAARTSPPSAGALKNGKTVLGDTDKTRVDETIGFIVFESGHGTFLGTTYEAATGLDKVAGVVNGAPFEYLFNVPFNSAPGIGITTMSGVDGGDGGWSQRHATSPSISSTSLFVSVDEDQIGDAERRHTFEQVSYLVFENPIGFPPVVAGCNLDSDCPGFADFCDGADTCNSGACIKGPSPCSVGETCNETVNTCEGPGARIETLVEINVGDVNNKRTVNLTNTYDSPVIVCSVQYEQNTKPVVPRVGNVTGTSFDLYLQNPGDTVMPEVDHVYCLVVEEGTWNVGGTLFEAQKYTATITDRDPGWLGTAQTFGNTYASPVIVGQVMSCNDPLWSVYWQSGSFRSTPPAAGSLRNGKAILEDPNLARADEEVGFIVFEAGAGTLDVFNFEAFLTADFIREVTAAPPYTHTLTAFAADPAFAVVSGAGVDGIDGYWPYLFGDDPVRQTEIDLAIDEDQLENLERGHTTEQIMGIVFEDLFAFVDNQPPVAQDDDFTTGEDSTVTNNVITNTNMGSFAYVTNESSDDVSVIDTSSNLVVATVPVGSLPFGVAVTPDGSRAYVANRSSADVSVIDTSSNTVVATVPVGGVPFGVAVTPDGSRAYVTNESSDDVSVIDTSSNLVVATVPVGSLPFGVAVTPDGSRAYVANNGSSTVSVIDTSTNAVVATVPVGVTPIGVAVTPDGSRAYVTNNSPDTVSVIETSSNTVAATVLVGSAPYGVAVTPDGSRAYVTNLFAGDVSVIDTSTNAVVATVPVDPGVFGSISVAVTPDGSRAYVANNGSSTVSVIDTSTNTVVDTVAVGSGPVGFGRFIGPAQPISDDSDPDGDPITVTLVNGAAFTSGVPFALPSGALLTMNTNGEFTYDPNGQFDSLNDFEDAPDSFTYTIEDPGGLSDTATVTITIAGVFNDPPTISVNTGITVDEGGTETINTTELDANDPDDSGDGLTYTLTFGPEHGQLEFTATPGVEEVSWSQTNLDNNELVYVHNGSATTSDSFNFTLADGGEDGALPATGTVNITVNPVPLQSRVFGTSSIHDSSLGGLAGADAICQARGATVDPAATWVAWLSDSSANAVDRLTSAGPFVRATDPGVTIADDIADLTDGTLDNAIQFDELGAPIPDTTGFGALVWTGTTTSGTVSGTSHSDNWTDPWGGAVLGQADQVGIGWTAGGYGGGFQAALYCFEIFIGAVNDPPTISVNTGITVDEGGTETINTTELDANDPDDSGDGLTYTLTFGPEHGQLEFTTTPGVEQVSWSQTNLDNNELVYVHNGSATTSDSFNFTLADGGEDGALPATGTVNITVNPVPLQVFVTSMSFTGDLVTEANTLMGYSGSDGLEAGDAICNHLASNANPSLPGSYRAWLSTSVIDARDRFTVVDEAWMLPGTTTEVASNLSDLIDGFINVPINVTESLDIVSASVWTSTDGNSGSGYPFTCNEWLSSAPGDYGVIGITPFDDGNWSAFDLQICSWAARLYCFGQ